MSSLLIEAGMFHLQMSGYDLGRLGPKLKSKTGISPCFESGWPICETTLGGPDQT